MLLKSSSTQKGFSFVEIMAALAILSVTLVTVVGAQSQSLILIEKSRDISFMTEIARAKMAEIELELAGKPFGELDDKKEGGFDEEGLESVRWSYEVKPISIPEEILASAKEQQGNSPVGFGVIAEALEKSMRQLRFQLSWGDENRRQSIDIGTLLIDPKGLPKFGGGAAKGNGAGG